MRHISDPANIELKESGFVFEVNGRGLIAFAARSFKHAERMCAESWFWEELAGYYSEGLPILSSDASCRVRRARPKESVELQSALARELAERTYEKFVFAFLFPLDPRAN